MSPRHEPVHAGQARDTAQGQAWDNKQQQQDERVGRQVDLN